MRLTVRRRGETPESITLPFAWDRATRGDAYTRIRNIYVHWSEGHSSSRAAAELCSRQVAEHRSELAPGGSRFSRPETRDPGNHIKEATWNHAYEPVVSMAVELLNGRKPPGNPADLLDACIRDWAPGSRMRQIRAQSLAQFLNHCVQRERFPDLWLPPADLKRHVGRKDATVNRIQKGDPFTTDQQILDLLEALPTDDAGKRWCDALKLLAELGLRPIELLHLSVRTDGTTGEAYLVVQLPETIGRRRYRCASGVPFLPRWHGGPERLAASESLAGRGDRTSSASQR